MEEAELQRLHKACSNNRASIKRGAKAGCFYCLEIFPKEDVQEWSSDHSGEYAICPRCGINSVISQSEFPSLRDLRAALRPMHEYWFKR